MVGLPDGLEHVRTTDVFDPSTVPAGLLRAHRVAGGVWGRLVCHEGSVRLVFEDDSGATVELTAGGSAAIPPSTPHHVELSADARFAVEFHREPE